MSQIPIARPVFGEEELQAVQRPLRAGWVMQGPEVAAFEREFSAAVGAPHACAVASGTAALHLALAVAGVGAGDEVLTVSHSFIATANAIRYVGAVPVFVDVEARTYNLDPAALGDALSPRTRAILCVHQLGMPCDLRQILDFARPRGLVVIEDAACAIGSEIDLGQGFHRVGRPDGDLACFSFHPRKVLTTGDGGMITTARADWDARLRQLRSHAMAPGAEPFAELGYNFRMTDLQAAVGRVQLSRLGDIVRARRRLAARYAERLADATGLLLPVEPAWARSNWQSYCVRLRERRSPAVIAAALESVGVATRPGIACAHRQRAYELEPWRCAEGPGPCGCGLHSCRRLTESERIEDEGLMLPLYAQMTDEEQDVVIEALRGALGA